MEDQYLLSAEAVMGCMGFVTNISKLELVKTPASYLNIVADLLNSGIQIETFELRHIIAPSENLLKLSTAIQNSSNITRLTMERIYDDTTGEPIPIPMNNSIEELEVKGIELDLENTNKFVAALSKDNSCLASFTLEMNGLNDERTEIVLRTLSRYHAKTLVKLKIAFNDIGPESSKALSSLLAKTIALKRLSLSYTNINKESFQRIIDAISNKRKTLTHVSIKNDCMENGGVEAIERMMVQPRSALQKLSLENLEMKAEDTQKIAKAFTKNTTLSKLILSGNVIDIKGAHAISLNLLRNTTLTELRIDSCSLGDSGVTELVKGLHKNTSLEKLSLTKNQIGCKGAQSVGAMLKCYGISLKILYLTANNIAGSGAKGLAEGLLENVSLVKLGLGFNKLADSGAVELSKGLEGNSSLKYVDLWRNGIGPDGAKAVAIVLRKNQALTYLGLGGQSIGDEGVKAIGEMLAENKTIRALHLSNVGVGIEGLKAFAAGLAQNNTLVHLGIGSNEIRDEGIKTLSAALVKNESLKELCLEYNKIGAIGVKAIAKVLKHNTTLTQLNLEENKIGAKGATELSKALLENKTLLELNIANNNTKSAGRKLAVYVRPGLKISYEMPFYM